MSRNRYSAEQIIGNPEVRPASIGPESPWENGYIESINGKLRVELLNGEIFDTIMGARVVTERLRRQYNSIRQPGSLRYRPLAP